MRPHWPSANPTPRYLKGLINWLWCIYLVLKTNISFALVLCASLFLFFTPKRDHTNRGREGGGRRERGGRELLVAKLLIMHTNNKTGGC